MTICNNDYVDNDGRVRNHCHITVKYRGSPHQDCNINLKLKHKILVVISQAKKLRSPSYYAGTR